MHEVLGLRDLSRTDLIVTADGEPVFLEVNVSPGMTETSSVPLAIEAADWSLGKMCADLVRAAAARSARQPAPSRLGGMTVSAALLRAVLGLVLAAGMVTGRVWQLEVYQRQGAAAAAARAAEPPVPLAAVAPVGSAGPRRLRAHDHGDGLLRAGARAADTDDRRDRRDRFVSLLRTDDGRALAVVRGMLAGLDPLPPPPPGAQQVRGVLLPSEEAVGPSDGPDGIGSVRIPQLAQRWPGPLVEGFVTLGPAEAQAQGLEPAPWPCPRAADGCGTARTRCSGGCSPDSPW